MKPNFWLERWQRGEIGWHEPEINAHLRDYWPDLRLAADAWVLVPLCGKSLDLLWLASRGHQVVGVEISRIAAEALFAEHGLEPTVTELPPFRCYRADELRLLCGDFFDLRSSHLGAIDAVFDRASLIALPPEMREPYAKHLATLAPTASRLLITLEYDQSAMAGPPFSVGRGEVERLFSNDCRVVELAAIDALDDAPGLRRRGLNALTERIWRLEPHGAQSTSTVVAPTRTG